MIPSLRYTLVGEGTSDRALMPLLRWALLQTGTHLPLTGEWADPARITAPKQGLAGRLQRRAIAFGGQAQGPAPTHPVRCRGNPPWLPSSHEGVNPICDCPRLQRALAFYPCDLLFVHRDADRENPQRRYEEIQSALNTLDKRPPVLCVIPVRMTEAWLLTDKDAICRAADNPRGTERVTLPPLPTLESIPDPKQKLFELLRAASGKQGRRLEQFKRDESVRRVRVAELTDDFAPLLALPAFRRFQEETRRLLQEQGWI